jgi:hypothetical protein
MVDIASGRTDRLLPDFSVLDYDISDDERHAVFTTAGAGGERQVWLASLDRREAPRQIASRADSAVFIDSSRVLYRSIEGHVNFVNRMSLDGGARGRVSDMPVVEVSRLSPDGRTVIVQSARGDNQPKTYAVPVDGGPVGLVCGQACWTRWSPDGRRFLIWKGYYSGSMPLVIVPVPEGRSLPEFPPGDRSAIDAWAALPGAESIERDDFIPTNDPVTYVFTKSDDLRNLFRIPLTAR